MRTFFISFLIAVCGTFHATAQVTGESFRPQRTLKIADEHRHVMKAFIFERQLWIMQGDDKRAVAQDGTYQILEGGQGECRVKDGIVTIVRSPGPRRAASDENTGPRSPQPGPRKAASAPAPAGPAEPQELIGIWSSNPQSTVFVNSFSGSTDGYGGSLSQYEFKADGTFRTASFASGGVVSGLATHKGKYRVERGIIICTDIKETWRRDPTRSAGTADFDNKPVHDDAYLYVFEDGGAVLRLHTLDKFPQPETEPIPPPKDWSDVLHRIQITDRGR
jgi:hypothetical protein